MTRLGLVGLVVALVVGTGACSRQESREAGDAEPHIVAKSGLAMGSALTLMAWTGDDDAANRAFEQVFAEFERLDGLLSVWKEGSDVARLNAAAGQSTVTVSQETITVLNAAREVSDWTKGKFDVTFGALSDVWKFDHDQDDTVPDRAAIEARLPLVDYRRLVITPREGTAILQRAGMRAHLGGIAKGYAVDRGVAILREAGLSDFSIQAGGDMYVAGMRGDRAVAARHRRSARAGRRRLRARGAVRQHVQHIRRLRALVHQGRRALPPHPGSQHR